MNDVTIIEAMTDPALLGPSFEGDSWHTWRSVLAASFGLPMTHAQLDTFHEVAGGREPPTNRVSELWAIAGRRSAKTQTAAAVSVYTATIGATETLTRLSPGERGVVALVATDRDQAGVAFGYCRGMVEQSRLLSGMVERIDSNRIDFTNRTSIQVMTCNFRGIRGRTLLAAVFDESAFWRDTNAANPDIEVYRAAVPALATTGGLLVGISSPYAKRGLVFDKYRKHYGRKSDVLVVQGETRDFNPTLDPRIVEQAMADDPEAARSEWLGQFRSDIAAFVSREIAEECVSTGVYERGKLDATSYYGFVDPSGGSQDSMTMAIAHEENGTVIVDLVAEARPPFSPESVTAEFAETLKDYGIRQVQGDRYAGLWPREQFGKYGITYHASAKPKSDLYRDMLPKLNSRKVSLIDNQRLINQLVGLERRTSRGGRDSIDHAPGMHDDVINAVAGVVAMTAPRKVATAVFGTYGAADDDDIDRGYRKNESEPSTIFGWSGMTGE